MFVKNVRVHVLIQLVVLAMLLPLALAARNGRPLDILDPIPEDPFARAPSPPASSPPMPPAAVDRPPVVKLPPKEMQQFTDMLDDYNEDALRTQGAPLPPGQGGAPPLSQENRMVPVRAKTPSLLPQGAPTRAFTPAVNPGASKGSWWSNWKMPWTSAPAPTMPRGTTAREIGEALAAPLPRVPLGAGVSPVEVVPAEFYNGQRYAATLPGKGWDPYVLHDLAKKDKVFFVKDPAGNIFQAAKTETGAWQVFRQTPESVAQMNLEKQFQRSTVKVPNYARTFSMARAPTLTKPVSMWGRMSNGVKGWFGGAAEKMFGKASTGFKFLRPI